MKTNAKQPGRIKAAVLNWLGVPIGLTDGNFWSDFYSSSSAAGQTVNQKTVMTLSAAWACTRLISETAATLPLKIYERRPEGRRAAVDYPLYNMLHSRPNADCTAVTFWESLIAAMLLHGNGRAEQKFIGPRLVALEFLIPGRLQPKDKLGNVFIYTDLNGKKREIPRSRVFHVPAFSLDGREGLSAISYGAQVFGSALASTEAANSTLKSGLMSKIFFKLDRVLKKEQREDFRDSLKAVKGALNAGESPLLEGGMDAEAISISPKDAQLLETRAFSVEDICRWFRVDPSMVGHGNKDSNWGTGLEQKVLAFLTFTLSPWLKRIEQAINSSLIPPQDRDKYYAEFSLEGLLRADSAARAAFFSVMVNNGIMTRDEVRRLENMPPKGGNADVLTVQSAMTPLDALGNQTDGDRARAALAAWLDKQEDNKNAA